MANQASELDVIIRGEDLLTPDLQRLESKVIRFVGSISAALAAVKIGSAPIAAATEFEHELAQVAKTTDFVSLAFKGQVGTLDQLSNALLDMSLRVGVTAAELAKIAAAAGQQGIGKFGVQGIVDFTQAVARMASTLQITADEAATNIGKIATVFRLPLSDLESAISQITAVSVASTASGKELLDTIRRIGDARGALTLPQAAGFAATGIDLGFSPEVVGTAISKMFNSAFAKADEFAKILKIPVKDWIKQLETDGPKAMIAFFDVLRTKSKQSQTELSNALLGGGGRQGSIVGKLLQDSTNSVLQGNLDAALLDNGTTAIKQQAKELNTLTEQLKILKNSLTKLGVDTTSSLLDPLKQYAAQLSAALQEPQVQSFVRNLVNGFADVLEIIKKVSSFVAGLNVNWENFIRISQVFTEIKLAQFIFGLLTNLLGLNGALKSLGGTSASSTSSLKKVGVAAEELSIAELAAAQEAKASYASRLLGLDKVKQKYQELTAAALKQKEIDQFLDQAAAARYAAKVAPVVDTLAEQAAPALAAAATAGAAARPAVTTADISAATLAVERQKQAVLRSEEAIESSRIALAAESAAKVEVLEAESLARQKAIEDDYQTKRLAIKATGTETGLKAARREKAVLLEEERAQFAASLAATQAYYAEQISIQRAALEERASLERTALVKVQATQSRLVDRQARESSPTAASPAFVGPAAPISASEVATAEKAAIEQRTKLLSLQSISEVQAAEKSIAVRIAVQKSLQEFDERSAVTRLTAEQTFNTTRKNLLIQGREEEVALHEAAYKKLIATENTARSTLEARETLFYERKHATEATALQEEIALQEVSFNRSVANFEALDALRTKQQDAIKAGAVARAAEAAAPKTLEAAKANVAEVRTIRVALETQSKNLVQTEEVLLQDRLAAIDREGEIKRQSIVTDYQTRRTAIATSGTEAGLKVNAAAQAKALAQESESRAISIAATREEYAQRLVEQRVFLEKQVAQARSANAVALLQQRTLAQTPAPVAGAAAVATLGLGAAAGAAIGTAGVAAASTAVSTAATTVGAGVDVVTQKLGFVQQAIVALRVAFPLLSSVIIGVGTALARLATVFATGALWVTIIYSVLDALHLLDGVTNFVTTGLTKLGDALGFQTSKTHADAIAKEEAARKNLAYAASLAELTKEYDKNAEAGTRVQNLKTVPKLVQTITLTADPAKQTELGNQLGEIVNAALLKTGKAAATLNTDLKAKTEEQVKIITDAKQKIEELQTKRTNILATFGPGEDPSAAVSKTNRAIAEQEAVTRTAQAQLEQYRTAVRGVAADTGEAAKLLEAGAPAISAMFNPTSLKVVESFVIPLKEAEEAAGRAQVAFSKIAAESATPGTNSKDVEAAAARVKAAELALVAANQKVKEGKDALKEFIATLHGMSLPPDFLASIEGVVAHFQQLTLLSATALTTVAQTQLDTNPALLDASKVPKALPPTSGDSADESAKKDAEARRVRAAERALAAAKSAADRARELAAQQEQLADEQRLYDKGIVGVTAFYAKREEVQQKALQVEIKNKETEISLARGQLADARNSATPDKAEELRILASLVKTESELAILRTKNKTITKENAAAEEAASSSFVARLQDTRVALNDALVLPVSIGENYANILSSLLLKNEAFINSLGRVNKELSDAFKIKLSVDAFTAATASITTQIGEVIDEVHRKQARLTIDVESGAVDATVAVTKSIDAVKVAIPQLEKLLQQEESQLATQDRTGAVGEAAYQRISASVDKTRLEIQQFQAQIVTLNKQILTTTNAAIDVAFKELSNTQTRLNSEAANGEITSAESARLYSDAIKDRLPAMYAQLAIQEKALEVAVANSDTSSTYYRNLAADVDSTRQKIGQLEASTDSIARSVNANLTTTLADALDKVTEYGSSLTDVVKGFLLSIAQSIKKIIFQNIAESLIGPKSAFGIGFQEALTGKKSKDEAAKNASVDKVGGTPTDANKVGKVGPTGNAGDAIHVFVDNTPKVETPSGAKTASDASVATAGATATPTAADTFPVTDGPTGAVFNPLHVIVDQSPEKVGGLPPLDSNGNNRTDSGRAQTFPVGNSSSTTSGDTFKVTNSDTQTLNQQQDNAFAPFSQAQNSSTPDLSESVGKASKALDGFSNTTKDTGVSTSGALGAMANVADRVSPGLGGMIGAVQSVVQLFNFLSAAVTTATAAEQAKAASSIGVGALHTGGIVGKSTFSGSMIQSRTVHPALFANAPRYHGGGTAGIRPGEVPAILQKGEAVLTKNQQSLVAAAMHPTQGPSAPLSIRNVLVADPSFVHDAMTSSQGERVLMSIITKNRATIRQAIN